MASTFNIILSFLQPIGLTITLVYVYGIVGRLKHTEMVRNIVMGGLFGLAVIASMAYPITLAEGFIFDLRNLLVGMACAMLGPVAGGIALLVGIVMRLYLGGQGAVFGVGALIVAACMGCWWRYSVRQSHLASNSSLLVLGAMISVHLLIGLFFPAPFRSVFFLEMAPMIFALNILSAWLLGRLVIRERLMQMELSDLRLAAETDPLTNLLNRRSVIEVVDAMSVGQGSRNGHVMLVFDIDHFKSINDIYGHLAGDKVLQCIGERIKSCLRPDDTIARLGGDEFVVLLPNATPDMSKIVAERCIKAISGEPFCLSGREIPVSISMGATWARNIASFDNMLAAADRALYEAKKDGRDCIGYDETFDTSPTRPVTSAIQVA